MESMDGQSVAQLASRLMAAPKLSGHELRAIADVADRGIFDDPAFVSRCVRIGQLPYVMWRAVRGWAQDAGDDGLLELAEGAIRAQGYEETDPPLDAGRLQVVLDLDEPKGWVVALWRDIYADHGQTLEIDFCLEYLTDRDLCWRCGDPGVAERDDLFWCTACLKKEMK